MNSFYFYNNIFERELKRKNDIEKSVSTPVTILTGIIILNSFIVEKASHETIHKQILIYIFVLLVVISFCISVVYLLKVYNNLFQGFYYKNLPFLNELREYEKEVISYNQDLTTNAENSEKINFEEKILDSIIKAADSHTNANSDRLFNLFKAKQFMIISLILTSIEFLILFIL